MKFLYVLCVVGVVGLPRLLVNSWARSRWSPGPRVARKDVADVAAEYEGGGLATTVDRAPRPTLRQRLSGLWIAAPVTAVGVVFCVRTIRDWGVVSVFAAFACLVAGVDAGRLVTRHVARRDASPSRRSAGPSTGTSGYSPIS